MPVSVNIVLAVNVEQLILIGGAASVTGSSGDDYIFGLYSANSLTLDGAGGNDYIMGSAQNDTLVGGLGNDGIDFTQGGNDVARYNAAGNMGSDVFYGFDADAAGGQDVIDLTGRGYASGDIGGAITLVNLGAHTIVQFASGSLSGTSVFLYDVTTANVTASDFVF